MKILIVHCPYQQRGGEDSVVADEIALLRYAGHDVETVFVPNAAISGVGSRIRTALQIADAPAGRTRVPEAIARFRPDVMHVHNFFPLVSPAVHTHARALGVATVQTLHNYRVTCAAGVLLRDGRPCETCVEGSPWNAVKHRCYRSSTVGSASLAYMIDRHRRAGTWHRDVDRFIALSGFARNMFARAGLPAERITIKPNAVADPGTPHAGPRAGVLYASRLSEEKGIRVLLAAARLTDVPITVIGDGPLATELAAAAPPNMTLLGGQDRDSTRAAMGRAVAVVVPSLSYEGFPLAVVEAFAAGTPVIAAGIGSVAEIVDDGRSGWHVAPGDAAALAATIDAVAGDSAEAQRRGANARGDYRARYTPAASLAALEQVYAEALARRHGKTEPAQRRQPATEVVHVG